MSSTVVFKGSADVFVSDEDGSGENDCGRCDVLKFSDDRYAYVGRMKSYRQQL